MGTLSTPRLLIAALIATVCPAIRAQQAIPGILPTSELRAGQKGKVWTVFKGTTPEPFDVEVTGVIENALGPGKSIILCELTDPRVQGMGAVAGMSGSPLYVEGKFAGALSYQVQRFETTRFAGFTPASDLAQVRDQVGSGTVASTAAPTSSTYRSLRPVFTVSGLSPAVADLMRPQLEALGLSLSALGGSDSGPSGMPKPESLRAGDAVSVALATGDITFGGTGTVSEVDGKRIVAFGHPMMGLGEVQMPMCAATIVTILPSTYESMKVANIGPVIGTIQEDRLSAVSGTLGSGPQMIGVTVTVEQEGGSSRSLHFQVVRQQQLAAALIASGAAEAIMGSNDAGLSNGFTVATQTRFSASQERRTDTVYAGPQSFAQGIMEFAGALGQDLLNPYEKTFPAEVTLTVKPLRENPSVTLDLFQLSRSTPQPGDTVQVTLGWRDYQGESHREVLTVPIDPSWAGKTLEIVAAPGRTMDELTGRPRVLSAAQLRSFDAYLDATRTLRPSDGLVVAVLEKSGLLTDESLAPRDMPASIERIAHGADEARFQHREALKSLWEAHVLPGKVTQAVVRRALQIGDSTPP